MSAEKKQSAPKKPDQIIPEGGKATMDLSVNSHEDWQAIRKSWAQTKVEQLQAKSERYFVTDEELPLSRHVILVTIAAFFACFVVWASFASLDEVTRGFGKIIPSSELQEVASLEPGIVEDFFVTKGERVQKGQLLVRLRDVAASSDLETNRSRYLGLLATVTRLQAEVDQADTISFPPEVKSGAPNSVTEELKTFRANKERIIEQRNVLEQQLAQRKQEVLELESRISDLKRVIALSRQEKAMIEPLVARGSAPKIELVQLERGIQQQVTELNSLTKSQPRAKAAVD
ncbi:MAG: HlyD family type I secretion periplasmic adaptor subunit, partial [Bdellovibrionales bacterium]